MKHLKDLQGTKRFMASAILSVQTLLALIFAFAVMAASLWLVLHGLGQIGFGLADIAEAVNTALSRALPHTP
jgi:hypothetical protein